MVLEHWQAWDINCLSRKTVPVSDHPHGKEMFPNVQSEPPRCSFVLFPHVLSLVTGEKRWSALSPPPLLRKLLGSNKVAS